MIASRIHQYLKSQRLMLIIVFGVVGVSILEVFLPPEPTLWVLFLPIIALSLFSSKPSLPIALAFVCTAILFFDHFVIERGEIWSVIFLKRSLGTVAFIALSLTINYALTIKLKQLDIQARLELSTIELSTEKLKLERSNRELEQFAGVAAHDLRSPIVTILSWLDILNLSIPNPKNQSASRALSIIEGNAKKANELVLDLLEMARLNSSIPKKSNLDLNSIVRETLDTLSFEIKSAGAHIEVANLPNIFGNKSHLVMIFSNLIRNSLTYREKSRRLAISIGFTDERNDYDFFVNDNGIGFELKYSERIFEMFKRLHNEKDYPGTGIGLALCKKIIELNGGIIWATSSSGIGSTFYFKYPKMLRRVDNET